MKILGIDGGGRGHASAWKFAQSPRVTGLVWTPANAGVLQERLISNGTAPKGYSIKATEIDKLLDLVEFERPDITFVGQDDTIALDFEGRFKQRFSRSNMRVFCPSQRAGLWESSKARAQEWMRKHGIPSAPGDVCYWNKDVKKAAAKRGSCCVLKADGLALGKGVRVCHNEEQVVAALTYIRSLGTAGKLIVVQDLLDGPELSLHLAVDGRNARLFPSSVDHKKVGDDETDPDNLNTGGMGTFSPDPRISDSELCAISEAIMPAWFAACEAEKLDFKGILYPAIMRTKTGPKVIEFNCRPGDTEWQTYMMRLNTDLVDLVETTLDGCLGSLRLDWDSRTSICIVLASEGYPGATSGSKGRVITGLDKVDARPFAKAFHAGTILDNGVVKVNGGRVVGIGTLGDDLAEARKTAYETVQLVHFEGMHYRRNIGLLQ